MGLAERLRKRSWRLDPVSYLLQSNARLLGHASQINRRCPAVPRNIFSPDCLHSRCSPSPVRYDRLKHQRHGSSDARAAIAVGGAAGLSRSEKRNERPFPVRLCEPAQRSARRPLLSASLHPLVALVPPEAFLL